MHVRPATFTTKGGETSDIQSVLFNNHFADVVKSSDNVALSVPLMCDNSGSFNSNLLHSKNSRESATSG